MSQRAVRYSGFEITRGVVNILVVRKNGDKHTILCDEGDWDLVKGYRWGVLSVGRSTLYARHGLRIERRWVALLMHRLIMGADGMCVDHINGNGLDNRRENLRICTNAENLRNRGASKTNTSGFKGVMRDRNKWRAHISLNDKDISIGTFNAAEDAARAYDEAARKYHGAFAKLNFP